MLEHWSALDWSPTAASSGGGDEEPSPAPHGSAAVAARLEEISQENLQRRRQASTLGCPSLGTALRAMSEPLAMSCRDCCSTPSSRASSSRTSCPASSTEPPSMLRRAISWCGELSTQVCLWDACWPLVPRGAEELLRRRSPLAQVQPWPLARCPLLLCRMVQDRAIPAPDPQQLLEGGRLASAEAFSQLRDAVGELCRLELSEHPENTWRAHAPAEATTHATVEPGASRQQPLRQTRSRRFTAPSTASAPWWVKWQERLTSLHGAPTQSCINGHRTNLQRVMHQDPWLYTTVLEGLAQEAAPVTPEIRPALWFWLVLQGEGSNLKSSWSLYSALCNRELEETEQKEGLGVMRKLILRDIERTPAALFGQPRFKQGAQPELSEMWLASRKLSAERMLMAFGRHRPEVGYCQGLNFVAAALLSMLDEQSGFVVFCGLVARLPPDLYSHDPDRLAQSRLHQQERISKAMLKELPDLESHFAVLQMDLNLFLPKWLTCLFAAVLPLPAVLRLWDHVLGAAGYDAVPRLALGVLAHAEKDLCRATDIQEVLQALSAAVEAVGPTEVDELLRLQWPRLHLMSSSRPTFAAEDASSCGCPAVPPSEEVSTNASTFTWPEEGA